jgi:hypothetical protein
LSELEDAVDTLIRLISSRIRVVKDNGSLASLLITEGNYDRELLKEYDGQICLSMMEGFDQRVSGDGRLRQEVALIKCSSFAVDKTAPGSDAGKVMRNKIAAQVKAIIRENRNLPYQVIYNFYGLGYPSGNPHKAFDAGAASELVPSSSSWNELSVANYQKLWSSDDVRHSKSHDVNNEYALMLFRFKIGPREQCVKKIMLNFEGYGTALAGNGITIKVWNHAASAWQQAQSGTGSDDETITITLSASWPDFIDSNGYIWLLAKTTNPSSDSTPVFLHCDFVQCTIQVAGITHCDIQSFKNVLVTDFKPYLHSTEFVLRAWFIVNVSGVF